MDLTDVTHLGLGDPSGKLSAHMKLIAHNPRVARVPPPSFSFKTEFEFHVSLVLKRIRFDSS